ncbi:MAG: hypothetical protein GTO45_15790 [Candidatus Aminicenantes bacterium]|nr:hypothetical protein [Candidatus Aminicenantes bacterium]NIN43468.1 hypothetical protein [Candidatus Aminicenantes bacterium]NIN86213.1 hypothetical protein [Candidatus Aminicenantes bacterium]NIR07062.1 hypothetical protein [Candidatus Aminicenantes bacterium]NIT24417.1 hypothetical protein [Candidatus Aminicenantes bacterium]
MRSPLRVFYLTDILDFLEVYNMIICEKCGSIASYNSYFGAYLCGNCHTKNYPSAESTNEKKENTEIGIMERINDMKDRLSRQQP